MARGERRRSATARTWLIRGLLATVFGLSVGAVVGVMGVRSLEPGRPIARDSVLLLLDSLSGASNRAPADARSRRREADSADAALRVQRIRDSIALARTTVTVPDVIGLEEGIARTRLVEARLAVGPVEFEDSRAPAGTVLRTSPGPGDSHQLNAIVSLVLSNGRVPPTLAPSAPLR